MSTPITSFSADLNLSDDLVNFPSLGTSGYNVVNGIRKYDVFLSFRGEYTRASFISNLSTSFQNSGVTVFKDDHSLRRGSNLSKSLLQAIKNSKNFVIIFSKHYPDSSWCMQELMQIMECHRTIGQVVLPVFYDVHLSEIRHQTGDFGKAFQNLLTKILEAEEYTMLMRRNTLNAVNSWPNLKGEEDDLWLHEWEEHGSCSQSEFNVLSYFTLALNIKDKLDILNVFNDENIQPSAMQTYDHAKVEKVIVNVIIGKK